MKALVKEFVTGQHGKTGLKIVELNKIVLFKNGKINKSATLKSGYTVVKIIKQPYGFGKRIESIVKFID